MTIQCRGCYVLGSACGECRRCCNELVALIEELLDPDPCMYDHDGNCQAHSMHSRPCPHEVAKHVRSTARIRHDYGEKRG